MLFDTEKVICGNSKQAQIADLGQEVPASTNSSVSILSQPGEMLCKCELFPDRGDSPRTVLRLFQALLVKLALLLFHPVADLLLGETRQAKPSNFLFYRLCLTRILVIQRR